MSASTSRYHLLPHRDRDRLRRNSSSSSSIRTRNVIHHEHAPLSLTLAVPASNFWGRAGVTQYGTAGKAHCIPSFADTLFHYHQHCSGGGGSTSTSIGRSTDANATKTRRFAVYQKPDATSCDTYRNCYRVLSERTYEYQYPPIPSNL